MESDLARIFEEAVRILRKPARLVVPKDIRDVLVLFVIIQERRRILAHEVDDGLASFVSSIEAGIAKFELETQQPFPPEDLAIYRTPTVQQELLKQARLAQMVAIGQETVDEIARSGLFFAMALGKQRFIIGTDAVFLDAQSNYRLIPIAPDIAIVIGDPTREGQMLSVPDAHVSAINKSTWQRSVEIVGSSREILLQVIDG
jgi:hypothetical protein